MRPINPYIVGNPVRDSSSFYGRQDVFREVMQVLRQRDSHAIVLYGQRRIGKTSMLLQLEQRLAEEGEFTPIYFDLQDKASKPLIELLYELAQHIARVTGHTVQKPADFDRTGDYFRDTFLPGIAEKVASGGLVLLFDEFDVLDSPSRTQASQAFFPYLRTWMENVQKVKFVFVIGRRPEELSVRSMSTFKGIQSTRVSFMSRQETESVIRQSEQAGSLKWEAEAVQLVYDYTHGHPYFTQLLCSVVWENVHEEDESDNPIATAEEVYTGVDQALKMGANAFNWLWDGLPPAERVIMSAMAEVNNEVITQDQLVESLNQSGVRLIARELELAPETLMDWELLYKVDSGYRFSVSMLRRWVLSNRPLRRVKDELDRLDPLADTLFQAGQGFYNSNRLEDAEAQLRQALNINPNHLKARLLLGRVYLDQRRVAESVEVLEAAYQYDERAARADLLKSLLALLETPEQDDTKQLEICERILAIQPEQPVATEKRNAIYIQRGDVAFAKGDYDLAAKAYQEAKYQAGIEKIRVAWLDAKLSEIPTLAADENWEKIIEVCEPMLSQYPDDETIKGHIENARLQLGITSKYNEALGALESGMKDKARKLFTDIVSENPNFGRASLKLVEAMYGKVKISFPIPLPATLLTFLTSFFWTLVIILSITGGISEFFLTALSEVWSEYQFIYIENFFLFGIIAVPLVGALFSHYANRVVDTAYQVEREQFSYRKALWTHFIFGMGIFYLDKDARRKWVYAILALLVPAVILGQLFYWYLPNLSNIEPWEPENGLILRDVWIYVTALVATLYTLSFIDVLVTLKRKQTTTHKAMPRPGEGGDSFGGYLQRKKQTEVDEAPSALEQRLGWRNAFYLALPVLISAITLIVIMIIEAVTYRDLGFYIVILIILVYSVVYLLVLALSDPQIFSWWQSVIGPPLFNFSVTLISFASYSAWVDESGLSRFTYFILTFVLPLGSIASLVFSNQKYGNRAYQTWLLFNISLSSVLGTTSVIATYSDTSDINIYGFAIPFLISIFYFSLTNFKHYKIFQKIGINISSCGLVFVIFLFLVDSSFIEFDSMKISYFAWPLLAGIIVSLLYKFNFNQIIGIFRRRS